MSFSGSASRLRLMFSTSTVASSTRMPTARASPPSVMILIVSPIALSAIMEVRIASGIEVAMITVLRQLPRKVRIMKAVRQAAISVSLTTPLIAPPSNIFDVDGSAANRLDRDSVQVRNRLWGCVGNGNIVFLGADLGRSRGQDQILHADRIHYIQRGQALRLQRGRIQIDLHLTLFAAIGIRYRCPRHGDELRPNEIEAIVVELLLRQILSRQSQLENRHTGCAVGQYEGRGRSRRKLPELGLRNSRNLRNTALNVRGRLQEDFNNRDSIKRLRLDVFDVVDGGGKRSLRDANDTVAHVLRDETVETPDDADNGNVDGRKNVGWSANDGKPAHNQDEYGHHHKCVRPP